MAILKGPSVEQDPARRAEGTGVIDDLGIRWVEVRAQATRSVSSEIVGVSGS
jgi:hypothetical protein